MDDVLDLVARPGDVGLTLAQRHADRVDGRNKKAVLAELVEGGLAHAGHDFHRYGDIGRIGNLNADGADFRTQRPHAERHDVHRAALHAALEQVLQVGAHLGRIEPVVGRAGVFGLFRADEGAAFDAGDVARVRRGVEGIGPFGRIEPFERAGRDQLVGQLRPLGLRPVAPAHTIRLRKLGDLANPLHEFRVLGWCRPESRDVALAHSDAPWPHSPHGIIGPPGSKSDNS